MSIGEAEGGEGRFFGGISRAQLYGSFFVFDIKGGTIGDDYAEAGVDVALNTDQVYFTPFIVPFNLTTEGIIVKWGGVAAGNVKVAIYNNDGTTPINATNNGIPDGATLVAESGAIAAGPINSWALLPLVTPLTRGIYWAALKVDNAADTIRLGITVSRAGAMWRPSMILEAYANAFGTPVGATADNATYPYMSVRTRSVP